WRTIIRGGSARGIFYDAPVAVIRSFASVGTRRRPRTICYNTNHSITNPYMRPNAPTPNMVAVWGRGYRGGGDGRPDAACGAGYVDGWVARRGAGRRGRHARLVSLARDRHRLYVCLLRRHVQCAPRAC